MAATFEIDVNMTPAFTALSEIPGAAENAASRAINRALAGARTDATKAAGSTYTIKRQDIRKTYRIERASKKELQGRLLSVGRRLGFFHYRVRPVTDTTGNKRRPVRVEIRKGSPFYVTDGFVWRGKVMQRDGPKRMPIHKMDGPAPPQLLASPALAASVTEKMQSRFEQRLEHEVAAILKGFTK